MLIHKYMEFKQLVMSLQNDIETLHYKNNYSAGTRVRNKLQVIRRLSTDLRELIQVKRRFVAKEKKDDIINGK